MRSRVKASFVRGGEARAYCKARMRLGLSVFEHLLKWMVEHLDLHYTTVSKAIEREEAKRKIWHEH